uniref:MYCL proto-oncogene, bHLH transcription factor b n=1 Tax=Poecilia reticulata TaxID=8081 RepID=A0A3P9PZG9_POERE
MPGISSAAPRYENWEMDHYQHYFYDDHDPDEDFFMSTAPSEDIWKKFELVPTPPMSPMRLPAEGSGKVGLGDKLEWVSQYLGQDDEHNQQQQQHAQELPYKLATSGDSFGNLSSIIIQDCMWSCFSAGQQLERVVGERPRLGAGGSVLSPWKAQSALADTWFAGGLAADCVDPAAVLTFPLPGGCKRKVSSGSESHTDSSEEIDVVTVDHNQQQQQHKPRRLVTTRKPVTITVRADPHDPGTKRFHISIHQQQHNYAAPSPDTLPAAAEPARKRVRQGVPSPATQRKSHSTAAGVRSESPNLNASSPTSSLPSKPRSHMSSPLSSDCEDTDKRKAHNFLERKRRNDLRSRFLLLRDEIPGLVDCAKTPKVAILTRATEYLQQLHAAEKQKTQERKQLKARQLQLLQRLAQLKRS